MSKHIFVATPMYGGACTGFFAQSLMTMTRVMRDNGYTMSFSALFNESLIQRGRNALVHGFLKTEATHLMFIDSDIRFNPEDVITMEMADKDIICGIYPKKEINWNSVEKAVKEGVPTHELKNYTGSLVVNLVDYQGEVTVPVNQPVEIWNGGTGFMLIKRSVFEKLMPVVDKYRNDVMVLSGDLQHAEEIAEFFPVFIEKESQRLLSEDYAFCKIARDNGIKVWAAPWVRLGHFGSYLFEGGLLPAP